MMYPHLQKQPEGESEWFDALIALARYLRSPEGCPWDRDHTAVDFARDTGEEAAELVEAFAGDNNDHIAEEWGDTLFTLIAAAAAAETEGRFTLRHALERTHEKMIRRHGHIFGDHTAETPEEVAEIWEKIKAEEKREA